MPPLPSPLFRFLLAAAFAVAGGVAARAQSTLPTGGHVVAGNASIGAPSGNTLSVTQTSPKAIVNWNTFSVGQPNAVNFAQPSSSAAILNQVTGATPSTIAGQINANGQVYLVNPNGIAITPSGSVQVGGGFVASTLGISNQNFMNGNLSFTGNGASAGVSNAGSITAGSGGYVGLVGGTAANSGVISVPLGKVALGSGEAATLDLNGGGFLQVAVPTGATTARGQALVSNSGKINAAGGTVELRAATVANAIRDAVNMSGTIAATSVSGQNGAITLSGGPGGAVNVNGTLNASAPTATSYSGAMMPTGNGGAIIVSGARVRIGHHAVLNASGAKGGSVLVGVTAPGGVGESQSTKIAPGATILATGNPAVAGSGGYIETSGGTLKFGGATINAGVGGTWLSDPTNLTIDTAAATTINGALNGGTNVIEETAGDGSTSGSGNTSSGPGDIIVDAALGWNTSATLTLSAFNGITVNAPITISGPGNLVLTTNNNINGTSTGAGMLAFTPGLGSAQFTSEASNPQLFINNGTPGIGNGTQYTLIYNTSANPDGLQSLNGSLGNFALAAPLDASDLGTLKTVPISTFSGNFNGLGNSISNLTINDLTDPAVGLFGTIGSTGSVSNLVLSGGSILGVSNVGALAGVNNGVISNVTSSVPVAGAGQVGGLVGDMLGFSITNSSSSGSVTGEIVGSSSSPVAIGGLIGELDAGSVSGSSASGTVFAADGSQVGGLIGLSNLGTTVSSSFATGSVTATQVTSGGNDVGGLIGDNNSTVTNSYATGAVIGGGQYVGGLIGVNDTNSGGVSLSYATGAVTGGFDVGGLIGYDNGPVATTNVYATGAVSGGGYVGGLIGDLNNNLNEAYATGPASGNQATFAAGGLVGLLDGGGSITDAYATGAVSGSSGVFLGGLAGQNSGIIAITNGYYDSNTTGMPLGLQTSDGSVGLTTAALQAALPTFQNPGNWGIVSGVSYPYLTAFYASPPQVISGVAYQDAGLTLLASSSGNISGSPVFPTVSALVSDTSLGSVTTGANGYFYFLDPAGTIKANSAVLTYTQAGTGGDAANGATLIAANGSVGGLTIWGGYLIAPTAATTYSAAISVPLVDQDDGLITQATEPNNNAITVLVASIGPHYGYIATGPSFTIDTPINQSSLFIQTLNGAPLTVNAPVTISGALTLDATGPLTVNSAMQETGPSPVILNGTSNASVNFTPTLGSLVFTQPEGSGQTLTINDPVYTLLYTAAEVQAINTSGLAGNYALANPVDATGLSWTPIGGNALAAFTGNFTGLGNTISNLTINDTADDQVGLFGRLGSGGTIGSIGVVGGSVTGTAIEAEIGALVGLNSGGTVSYAYATGPVSGGSYTGGLVGVNEDGTITNSYAIGAVSGGSFIGGLVGANLSVVGAATISNSYATGAVTNSAGLYLGGLVGLNVDESGHNLGATISDSYATGAVTGGGASVAGGLVGANGLGGGGTIIDAYATGPVSGSGATLGGLVGLNGGGTITDGYYDAGTTGMPLGPQADGSVGLTTAELQSFEFTDTANFQNNTLWGIIPGVSYPYLCWQFGGCGVTPQVVSGTVFQDQGMTPAGAGITVTGLVDGSQFNSVLTGGTVTTGANGYYYYLLAPNTIPSGGGVLTYAQNYPIGGGSAASGAAFADGIASGGSATGLTIFASALHEITPDTANSTLQGNLATAAGVDPTAVPLLASLPNLQIDASASTFDVDTAIFYPTGTVTLNANALTESAGTITASSLVTNSVNSVDLSGNNAVGTFAASVTGSGVGLDFLNTQSFAVGGITTNNGAVALEATSGDIGILFSSINTVNGGSDPSVGSAGVALSAPNGSLFEIGGSIVAPAVVASAANGIDFASFAGPNAFLTFAGQVTGSGQTLSVLSGTSLTIDNVSVAAGPLSLSLSGVTTNDGEADIGSVLGALKLNQPVNTNNGSTMLGASPGLANLVAFGDITQSTSHGNNGLIIAGQLYADSLSGNVILTAPNRLGANDNGSGIAQTAGLLAGFATGNFEFVDHNAPLTIDTLSCGCLGIFTEFGNIQLATTGAGAITVNQPMNSGGEINIAVAPGYGFTNNASDNPFFDSENGIPFTAGLDTSFSGAPIVILADGMNLSGGTINAGFGPILLGPASLNTNVSLGTPSTINADGTTSGPLGLTQADINSITAAFLQIGYRNVDGSVSFNGAIDVASNIQINTNNINDGFGNSTLLLVTGGAVTESGGALSATGPNTLSLGVLAGSATMNQDNAVGTLAAFTDGASANFSFVNSGQALAVDALFDPQAGLLIDRNGFPSAFDMLGAAPNPLAGITTANGNVSITVANSGALAINQPINAGTGSVTAASVGDLTIGPFGSVTGNTITLATLGNFTNNAGPGALDPPGQWLVYSTNPANDNDGGLTPNFIQYAATYPVGTAGSPTPPAAPGNGFLYSVAPIVTVDSVTKVYDGTTNLPTNVADYTFGGVINGDSVSLVTSGVTGAYASPNAGTGIAVTLTGLTFSATNASGIPVYGYGLTAANSGDIGTITPATLTASIIGNPTKVYDGTTNAALGSGNFLLSGFVAGQGATVSALFGNYNSANVATATTVMASLVAGDFTANAGTLLSNYTLPAIASGAGAITPATLTAAIVGNPTRVYDGTTIAALTPGNFSLSGFITGQGVIVSPLFGNYNSPNVATAATVTASLVAGDFTANPGTLLSNYTLPAIASGAGAITPATLTASIIGNPTKVYDGTTNAALGPGNFSLSGFIAGQGGTVSPLTGAYNSPNVATATTITASLGAGDFTANAGTLLSNYALPTLASGPGTITPESLRVAANDLTRLTGQPNPQLTYTITLGSLFNGDVLSGSLATSATASSIVGTYPIAQGTLAANPNYTLTFIDGTLTVVPIPETVVAIPGDGVSPLLFSKPFIGPDGFVDTGPNGTNPNLTNCSASSIAGLLKGAGKATLYGGGACGNL